MKSPPIFRRPYGLRGKALLRRDSENIDGTEIFLHRDEIAYTLKRDTTLRQTGFFIVVPDEPLSPEEALALLKTRPLDDFLHQYLLTHFTALPAKSLQLFLARYNADGGPVCRALAAEHLLLTEGRGPLGKRFSTETILDLSRYTPLIYLRSFLEPEQDAHSRWTTLFRDNIFRHRLLPAPDKTGLPPLHFKASPVEPVITLAGLAEDVARNDCSPGTEISPAMTADRAAERLARAGVKLGQLMRHEASLSPIGLLRSWRFTTRVDNGRNRYTLSGEQISYGRGLSLDTARASLMMEIVERCSAFASISENGLADYRNAYPLCRARFSELFQDTAVDPASLALEVSYRDQPLHWVQGETPDPAGGRNDMRPIWIPVQCLFMFCNLDEPALFSGLGSTGLASGNTRAQARVAALLEIIERHQAATVPYDTSTCFRLVAHEPQMASLLEAYHQAGIDIWFQDITPAMGIPCCRCFVVEQTGTIHSGTAAHLDARRAIISALTETTCPFPHPPPTRPAPADLMLVGYENLPDYSTHDATADLGLLETLLIKNDYHPCYVDLTRQDIDLPVAKALVPGLELLGDFDIYSRVHPELYSNYMALFK